MQTGTDEGGALDAVGKSGPPAEGRPAAIRRRIEYATRMLGRHTTLTRLRKSRRLPLTEAAFNGHYEVLQVMCYERPVDRCSTRDIRLLKKIEVSKT